MKSLYHTRERCAALFAVTGIMNRCFAQPLEIALQTFNVFRQILHASSAIWLQNEHAADETVPFSLMPAALIPFTDGVDNDGDNEHESGDELLPV